MSAQAAAAFAAFFPQSSVALLEALGQGLINDTWLVQDHKGASYVLQQINTQVFPQVQEVQENLVQALGHLHAQMQAEPDALCLFQVYPSTTGAFLYADPQGRWWRLLSYIQGTTALSCVEQPEQAQALGAALGRIHRMLATLDPLRLIPPTREIHNVAAHLARYDALRPVAQQAEDASCAAALAEGRVRIQAFQNAQDQGAFRQQVIHGDPKVNNFLFAKDKKRVISLIDWDTVRHGPLLHDLGDALRSCCNPQGEENEAPVFQRHLFAAWLKGYLGQAVSLMATAERRFLIDSVQAISFELGLRFYNDYLAGNPYFKVRFPLQNLQRAKGQFALARSIAEQYPELVAVLKSALDQT